jgi:glycogen debranching enzyme
MTEGWAFGGSPPVLGRHDGLVTLVEGPSFCICEASGDIRSGGAQGLFFRDTRFINRLELAVDGQVPESLAAQPGDPFACTFIGRRPPRSGFADSTLLVVRSRYVGHGLREDITLRNLGHEPAGVNLTVSVGGDFADLFEVKGGRVRPRSEVETSAQGSTLRFQYEHLGERRGVTVTASGEPSAVPGAFAWQVVVPARGTWSICLEVVPSIRDKAVPPLYRCGEPIEHTAPAVQLSKWRSGRMTVSTADDALEATLKRSVGDLGGLRIFDPEHPERVVVAAGAPWFMTVFGRDSLLTSWMLLPLDRSLAVGTLQTLARFQGRGTDAMTEEQPGRILHEMRFGMDASLALGGGSVYYGTADATPLFVMLMGELLRWGPVGDELRDLLPHADRALDWIEHGGDLDGDGFLEYRRATDRGLVNQGWKDSFDGVTFARGAIAEPPIALAEVQGYVYAAYRARASLARAAGDRALADSLTEKAADLKKSFNKRFWLADRGYFALGLDGSKQPIDALASNMGHCLWTGIVDDDKAAQVAGHLVGDDLFSGFGVRTLAQSMRAYNPMSYHNGSVWPHDNAICAAGLMRYGFIDEAQRIATAILDAAEHFDGRLPELFCGFDRADFAEPVPYPTSCSPQAWAAAAPYSLLRTLLRFDPDVASGKLQCDPAVPTRYLPLRIAGLEVDTARLIIEVKPGDWTIDGVPDGVEIVGYGDQR